MVIYIYIYICIYVYPCEIFRGNRMDLGLVVVGVVGGER